MSNESSHSHASGGIGLCSALFLLFLGLKLGKVIDWSWWWIFSPFWIPVSLATFFVSLIVIITVLRGRE